MFQIEMSVFVCKSLTNSFKRASRQFVTGPAMHNAEGVTVGDKREKESERMKKFHEKLKLQSPPRVRPNARFVELVLVDVDPTSGDLITNSEKDPTKWGDWQTNCRVSDF